MKNEYKVTRDLMRSWAREYHLHGAASISLFVFWCAAGIIGIWGVVLSIVYHSDWTVTYLYALAVVLAVFKLFFSRFFVLSRRYKLFSTTYGVTEWLRTTEFLNDEIVLTDHTSISKLKYGNIQKIKEKGNVVMLFMNNNMALRLYKDAFVEGSWQECKKIVLQKMNKS